MSWKISLIEPDSKPIRVAVGILKRDNKILIAQRPVGKAYDGLWEFPGGKVEVNESGINALHRELKEELGIDVIEAQFLFSHTHAYPSKTVLLEIWLVTEFLGEPSGKENQALHWATLAEILEWPLLEGNKTMIERIKMLFITSPRELI